VIHGGPRAAFLYFVGFFREQLPASPFPFLRRRADLMEKKPPTAASIQMRMTATPLEVTIETSSVSGDYAAKTDTAP
jgi:hypothetical protein